MRSADQTKSLNLHRNASLPLPPSTHTMPLCPSLQDETAKVVPGSMGSLWHGCLLTKCVCEKFFVCASTLLFIFFTLLPCLSIHLTLPSLLDPITRPTTHPPDHSVSLGVVKTLLRGLAPFHHSGTQCLRWRSRGLADARASSVAMCTGLRGAASM